MIDHMEVQEYMQHLPKHDLLTAEQEYALFQRVTDPTSPEDSSEARQTIVEHNYRLVVSQAIEMLPCTTMDFEDIVQQGMEGLLIAVDKFQPEYGVDTPARFSTYAYYWIMRYVRRAVSDHSRTVRIPAHVHDAMSKVRATNKGFPEGASLEEMADANDMSVEDMEWYEKVGQPINSLDSPLVPFNQEQTKPLPTEVQTKEVNIVEAIDLKRDAEKLMQSLKGLPPRTQLVLEFRMGLKEEQLTYQAISDMLGVTKQRVRQIEYSGIEQLRKSFKLGKAA